MRVLLESAILSMTAARRQYNQEFKDELCLEVISTSKTIKEVAVAYDVGPETLRNWWTSIAMPRAARRRS